MCHGITWYHALCLHPNPVPLFYIACERAFKTGEYCYGFECICIPMIGACNVCNQEYSNLSQDWLPPGLEQIIDDEEYDMVDGTEGDEDRDNHEFYRVIF